MFIKKPNKTTHFAALDVKQLPEFLKALARTTIRANFPDMRIIDEEDNVVKINQT